MIGDGRPIIIFPQPGDHGPIHSGAVRFALGEGKPVPILPIYITTNVPLWLKMLRRLNPEAADWISAAYATELAGRFKVQIRFPIKPEEVKERFGKISRQFTSFPG